MISSVPEVNVQVVHVVVVPPVINEVVPAVLLIITGPILVLVRSEPVPTIVDVNAVSTDVLLKEYKEFKFKVVAARVKAVVPKLISLNQLPVVIVGTEAPLTK